MSKVIEKNAILSDIIQKSLDIIQLYGLNSAELTVKVNARMVSGGVFISYTQKENDQEITISRKIT